MSEQPVPSQVVTEESVLAKCRYFVNVGLWPRLRRLDPIGWLENFTVDERIYALHLLNGFMYFSPDLIEQLFLSAFRDLGRYVLKGQKSPGEAVQSWRRFLTDLVVVRVTGEIANDTDSGYLFARMARDLIGIPEERIISHPSAINMLRSRPSMPVIFVDDFVGSGYQFVTMWIRTYKLPDGSFLSFNDLASSANLVNVFYNPLICTAKGADEIRRSCPGVVLSPAHELSERYNSLDPDSLIWPEDLRSGATDFLLKVSQRAGIPDRDGGLGDWRGFHKLGLTLSFAHGTPDATLPIFYWNQNSWKPLVIKP